jgi:hypothetical protein
MSFQDHADLAAAPKAAAPELPDGFGRTVMLELKCGAWHPRARKERAFGRDHNPDSREQP